MASIPSSPRSALPSPPHSPSANINATLATTSTSTLAQRMDGNGAGGGLDSSVPASPALSISSSFPSGASSYMFSISANNSPPYISSAPATDNLVLGGVDPALGLVIPSLVLPSALESRRRTTSNPSSGGAGDKRGSGSAETLGKLDLLIVGRKGAGKSAIGDMLVQTNEDVVRWEAAQESTTGVDSVLVASTVPGEEDDWNVRVCEMEGFDEDEDQVQQVLQPILNIIHARFSKTNESIAPAHPPTKTTVELLQSDHCPLHTGVVFLLSSPPTSLELTLLSHLSSHITTITLPPYPPILSQTSSFSSLQNAFLPSTSTTSTILIHSLHSHTHNTTGSPFRPRNAHELREELFRNPSAVKGLRRAAVEKFLVWREDRQPLPPSIIDRRRKMDWEQRLSQALVSPPRHRRSDATITQTTGFGRRLASTFEHEKFVEQASEPDEEQGLPYGKDEEEELDPLHLPTLLRLSAQLLSALGRRVAEQVKLVVLYEEQHQKGVMGIVGVAFVLGFCAGLLTK